VDVTVGYRVAPAQCYCCGSGDQTRVTLDIGDHPGVVRRFRVYLCDLCVTAAAKKVADYRGIPWLSDPEARELLALATQTSDWQARAEAAEAKLATLSVLVADL